MSKRPLRSRSGLLVAIVLAVCAPAARAQEPSPGVATGKTSYAWTDTTLGKAPGEPVEIRNETGKDATAHVVLTMPTLAGNPITYAADPIPLAPGASTIVAFHAAAGKLAKGTYAGTLAVFCDGADAVARLPVTLTVGEANVALTPASDEQTMQGVRWVPLVDRTSAVSGHWIALDGTKGDVKADTYLGSLAGDKSGVAAVYATGKAKELPSGRRGIEVSLRGFDGPGTYKGKLDLEPDADGGNLTLTVLMKDSIIWAVLALIAGIEAALRTRRWQGNERVLVAFGQEEAQASRDFETAARAVTGERARGFLATDDFERKALAFRERLAELSGRKYVDMPEALQTELHTDLDALTQAVKDFDAVPNAVSELEASLEKVERLRAIGLLGEDPPPHPRWLDAASALLEPPSELTIAGLHERLVAMRRATAFADTFCETAAEVAADADDLRRMNPQEAEEKKKVTAATGALASAWSNLWKADKLADAYDKTARQAVADASRAVRMIVIAPKVRRKLGDAGGRTEAVAADALAQIGVSADAGERVTQLATKLRLGDAWMRAFAYLIAIGTGLGALYIGKPFGTPIDYLQALLWGGATAATLDVLANVVGLRSNPEDVLRPPPA